MTPRVFACIALLATATACGADAPGSTADFDASVTTADADGSLGQTSDGAGAEDVADVACKRSIIPQFDTTKAIELMNSNAPYPLLVTVFDVNGGGPVGGASVHWEIVENMGPDGPGPGVLGSAISATADQSGSSYNAFKPGTGPAAHYKLRLSTECADDLTVEIQVSALPTGMIKVYLLYTNPLPLGDVDEYVITGPFACASFKWTLPPVTYVALKTTHIGDVPPTYGPLPPNQKYAVVALGKNLAGEIAAVGCVDSVYVGDQGPTAITLTMVPLQAP